MSRAIVATGSVNPVITAQVGTYVSVPIQSISCDFNTQVEAGQLSAKIDPRPDPARAADAVECRMPAAARARRA